MDIKFDTDEKWCEGYFVLPGMVVLCPKGLNHRDLSGKKPSERKIISETIKIINHESLHLSIAEAEDTETSELWDCLCLHDPEYV